MIGMLRKRVDQQALAEVIALLRPVDQFKWFVRLLEKLVSQENKKS
jgi:hypothetical protein